MERRDAVEQEIAELRERSAGMKAQWQAEKEAIQEIQARQGRSSRGCGTRSSRPPGAGDLQRAAELRYGRIPELERELAEDERRLAGGPEDRRSYLKEEVDAEDIAEIVSKWTGIPVTKMLESERERLTRLEEELGAAGRRPGAGA